MPLRQIRPYNALVLGVQVIQPSYHLTTDPISTPIEQRLLYTGGQAIKPHRQDHDHKESKRAVRKRVKDACVRCRRKKRQCTKDRPCPHCVREKVPCEHANRPVEPRPVPNRSQALEKEVQRIEYRTTIASATGASVQDEGSVSSSSMTPAAQASPLDPETNWQRCLVKHRLCPQPKNTTLQEQSQFFVHAFIPGRTIINNHLFCDVLRLQGTITYAFMLPALTTLYLEQVQKWFVTKAKRQVVDQAVIQLYVRLWSSDDHTTNSAILYFTLLANQYTIIRPRLRTCWTQYFVPSLRSNAVQRTLQQHGDLRFRLKINSHWIFSNIAFGLRPDQPRSFLLDGEESLNEIDPLVGLSPRLLNIYAGVTRQLHRTPGPEMNLLESLTRVEQHLPHLGDLPSREVKILEDCASAYLHGAHIYVLCRLERRPASYLTLQQHQNELYQLLDPTVLPLSRNLYSAVWPLAAAFILCVTCVDKEERHILREGLIQDLHESGGYSNIPAALDAISMVWHNPELDMRKEGWWEDMVAVIGPERISLT